MSEANQSSVESRRVPLQREVVLEFEWGESMDTAGLSPSMRSTSGFASLRPTCR